MSPQTVTVSVPATSANLGPGFDVLGLALPLYNRLTLSARTRGPLAITHSGPEAHGLATDASHLAYRAAVALCEAIDNPVPNWQLAMDVHIPLSRGLGSSASAIVGGLVAANAWFDSPLDTEALLQLAWKIEGHPDNVAPALFGGVSAAFIEEGRAYAVPLATSAPCGLAVAIPDFELATTQSRRALPETVLHKDAVRNLGYVTILTTALTTGTVKWLKFGLKDVLHQPYRLALIPGAQSVFDAAVAAGAWGAVISGAGPSLMAFCPSELLPGVAAAMASAWSETGISSRVFLFERLAEGAAIE